ncbi:MAG: NB-ARC domain-containing protein [Frankiaceae bacterium]
MGDEGPDPARVLTIDDLSRELNLLRARAARGTRTARVSLDDLARRMGEPKSSVHAYVTGRRLPPAQVLDRMVIALQATPPEQREWAEAWYRVSASWQAARRDSGDAAMQPSVPHQLPPAVGNFVGRAEQLLELDELAREDRAATIVAVCGTPGVGKTALVLHWAQTRQALFPDGQLYVDLCGCDAGRPMQPGHALARLLRALGLGNQQIARETDERAAQLRSLLSGRRMLIVLDNARDTEQVRSLLPGPPSCTLVTSRDSLSGLVARHGAHRLDLDALPLAEAVELLRALTSGRHDDTVGSLPAPTLGALAEQCARLPLALRIAADVAWSRPDARVDALVDDLALGEHPLDLLEAGDDPRTALRAVFSWSYRQLPAEAARAFRLMGLHSGVDLTPEGLAALIGVAPPEAHRLIALLAQAHLVRQTGPAMCAMHNLLRSYARELALAVDPEPERSAALDRLRGHYLRATDQPFALSPAPDRAGCPEPREGSSRPRAVPSMPSMPSMLRLGVAPASG